MQGVYYRAATLDRALDLGLRGWVKNLPSGQVEVVAAGSLDALQELAAWLWVGSPAASVTDVNTMPWREAIAPDFSIR